MNPSDGGAGDSGASTDVPGLAEDAQISEAGVLDAGDAGIQDGHVPDVGSIDGGQPGPRRLADVFCSAGPYPAPRTGAAATIYSPAIDDGQGFHIAEGAVWIRDALYFSVIFGTTRPPGGRIEKLEQGQGTLFLADASSNGLAVDLDDRIYATDHASGVIRRFSVDDPAASTVIADTYEGARFNSPNDLVVHSNGSVYFTDPDWQAPASSPQTARRIYRVAPSGEVNAIEDGRAFSSRRGGPNGIALSLDESKLYVSGNAPKLLRFAIAADGSAVPDGEISLDGAPINISGGLDGMTMDCAGHLYVTHGTQVVILDVSDAADIRRVGTISVPGQATNVAFGGTTLYITSLNPPQIHSLDVGLPGLPY